MLLNLIFFSLQSSVRDLEREKAEWFLEGRIQDYFDALMTGKRMPENGNFDVQTDTDDDRQTLEFKTVRADANSYRLSVSLFWKNRYRVSRTVQYRWMNLSDYTLFFNGPVVLPGIFPIFTDGKIVLNDQVDFMTPSFPLSFLSRSPYRAEVNTFFSKIPRINSFHWNTIIDSIQTVPVMESGGIAMTRTSDRPVIIPDFNTVRETFSKSLPNYWSIDQNSFYPRIMIKNALSSEKTTIGYGDGYSVQFSVPPGYEGPIFIRKRIKGTTSGPIDTYRYSYSHGTGNRNLTGFRQNRVYLNASVDLVKLKIPAEAFQKPGTISLQDDKWSVLSIDEDIDSIYLNNPSVNNELHRGTDYLVTNGSLKILSDAFRLTSAFFIGMGNGKQKVFPLKSPFTENTKIILGDQESHDFNLFGNRVQFQSAPPPGIIIKGFNPPDVFLKKKPPAENTMVMIDLQENAYILDLDKTQNLPSDGLILSTAPLLIRGECRTPLVVISSENIYIETLNPKNTGEPVLLASHKGIWVRGNPNENTVFLNNCFLYSPLPLLPCIGIDGQPKNIELHVYGSAIFTSENTTGVMKHAVLSGYFFFSPIVQETFSRPPFSLFPKTLTIDSLTRH